ncbi:polycystic kidney disease protein 1 2 [Biomphalaria glabrata]|nr:polycystic kidney disease protein 1 2 [Biomphalaria glabrata]
MTHVKMTHVKTTHVKTTHVKMTHVKTTHVKTTHVKTTHVKTTHVKMTHVKMTHVKTTHVKTTHVKMTHVKMTHVKMTHVKTTHVKTTHVKMTHVKMTHVKTTHVKTTHVKMTHVKILFQNDPRENDPRENDPRENDPRENDPRENDPRENDPRENDPRENDPRENDPRENDPRENDPRENDPRENDPRENDPRENDPRENDPRENDPRENDPRENDPRENDPRENDPRENDPRENDPRENDPRENDPRENDPRENDPRENDPRENDPRENDPRENDPRENDPRENDQNVGTKADDFSLEDIDLLDINSRKLHVAFAILCMWLIVVALLVWTTRRDRLEATMGKTFILPRIFSWYQGEHYLVCIVTGYTYDCGTKLTPTLTIIGSSDVSFVYVLFPQQEILKTGSEVWFILSCSEDLGTIQSCVLSLPMSTFKDSWHVSHILFRNLRTQEDRYCICDAWIPDVKTNVNFIVRPVTPVPGKNVRSLIFKLMYFMRMLHVVIGIVFNMPGRSFNKSLHVICCFFTLLTCMLFCVWTTGSVELELKGDIALVSEEKHYQNLALEVNLSATASSIVSFCVIVWFEVIEHLPTNNVLHWPLRMEYADGSDRNLNSKEDGLRQESIGRMMGRAYNRSLASIDLHSSPRSSSIPSIHTQVRLSRQSLKSLQSAQPEAGVKRSKLSLSIFQQMLVNIGLEKYIFRKPKKSKNWKGFVRYCSVSLLILLIVFLSVFLAALGTRINSSGYYLTVSLMTFLIVLIIWHPVFIVIVTFLFVEKYKLGKSDADSRVKGWSAEMYTQVQMLDQNKAEALRNVSYKHTYIPVAKKYIYRKQCAQITKSQQIGAGTLVNEDHRETSVKRVSLFVFIIVVVIIINLQSGSVSERYMQTKFMRQLIEVGREEIELRQVIEYNDFWEHLRSKFHLATHWSLSNKNTTASFKTVSNVRVRQIRAAAYKGRVCF